VRTDLNTLLTALYVWIDDYLGMSGSMTIWAPAVAPVARPG